MMTREEMCEAIQRVDMLLEQLSDLYPKFCDWEAIKRARANLANVLAALEGEKPLAEGESRIKVYGESDRAALEEIWFLNRLGLKPGRHPVRVAIYAKEKP